MDDLINEIINYVSETPENTNSQVLRPMLERLGNSGSGGSSGSGAMIVKEIQTGSRGTLDKTFQEIFDAIMAGKNVYVWPNAPADASFPPNLEEPNDVTIYPAYIGFHSVGSPYQVLIGQSQSWHADTLDGYPTYYYD